MLKPLLRGGACIGLVAAALTLTSPGQAQAPADGYTYHLATAAGDGVTVELQIDGLLPIEDLVGLSSVTSEASIGVGRSDALAALPDPGDLILTLPGTLAALAGVPGLPDYPAASRSEHPAIAEDEVVLVPDGGLGATRLRTRAVEDEASASAAVTDIVDAVGLLPAFSIGSVQTTAVAQRLSPTSYRSTATSTISDVRLLGGLLRIDQITSEVTTQLVGDRFTAEATKVDVSGATVAGTPIGITDAGIVGLGQPVALAPVIDQIVAPLLEEGIRVHTTPSSESVDDGRATASGGTLSIDMGFVVQERPATFSITLGRVSSSLEASGGSGTPAAPATTPPSPGAPASTPSAPTAGLPSVGGSGAVAGGGTAPSAPSGAPAGSDQLVTVGAARTIAAWQVTGLYRALLLGGALLAVVTHLLRRFDHARLASDLRPLWRW